MTAMYICLLGACMLKMAAGESFVSALFNKYEKATTKNDREQQEVEIFVPKSAPGYTS